MSERNLLASCIKSRSAHSAVSAHILQEDMTEQGHILMEHIGDYYDSDTAAQSVDPELLKRGVERALSNPKHVEMFTNLIDSFANTEVSAGNVVRDFLEVKRDVAGSRLAQAIAAKGDAAEIADLVDDYQKWCAATNISEEEEEDEVLNGLGVESLINDNFDEAKLIKVFPRKLNEKLGGGLLPGHHVVVFARPEMGKTALVLNAIAGFLKQGKRVLYIGNEEPITDTCMRIVCRLSGMTKFDVVSNPTKAQEVATQEGYDNLFMASLAPGTPRRIEELVVQYEADVLVVDQLRNLNMREDNFTQQLEKAARAVRAIGKRHGCLVLSVTQAGDSATGKAVLDMGDVDSSNTGIPAQADVMIGLGATAEDERNGRRVISLPKNKPGNNHDFFPVVIETPLSKFRSIA